MKTCRKCRAEKAVSAFGKCATQKDGLKRCCKECRNKATEAWRIQNPQKHAQKNLRWIQSNREKARANRRKCYQRNPKNERVYQAARFRKMMENNPEGIRRVKNLRNARKHGVPEHLFESLETKRQGSCCICGAPPDVQKYNHTVDHDHTSGDFRGILCHRCNTAVGLLKDDPERCEAMAEYLQNPPGLEWLKSD